MRERRASKEGGREGREDGGGGAEPKHAAAMRKFHGAHGIDAVHLAQ